MNYGTTANLKQLQELTRIVDNMSQELTIHILKDRRDAIAAWLLDNAAYTQSDQRHLDTASPEQAYWHLGYVSALNDMKRLFLTMSDSNTGKPNGSP